MPPKLKASICSVAATEDRSACSSLEPNSAQESPAPRRRQPRRTAQMTGGRSDVAERMGAQGRARKRHVRWARGRPRPRLLGYWNRVGWGMELRSARVPEVGAALGAGPARPSAAKRGCRWRGARAAQIVGDGVEDSPNTNTRPAIQTRSCSLLGEAIATRGPDDVAPIATARPNWARSEGSGSTSRFLRVAATKQHGGGAPFLSDTCLLAAEMTAQAPTAADFPPNSNGC